MKNRISKSYLVSRVDTKSENSSEDKKLRFCWMSKWTVFQKSTKGILSEMKQIFLGSRKKYQYLPPKKAKS